MAMGIRMTADIPQQIWARELANGDVAVELYNKGTGAAGAKGAPANIAIDFSIADLKGPVAVFDIWAQRVVGTANTCNFVILTCVYIMKP